jgi:hypothetical protein
MKQIVMLSFAFVMIMGNWSCNAQTNKKDVKTVASTKVEVYYFHFTSRCVTCKTVEAEAKADIESLYGGKVTFQAINLDDESSKAIAEKLQIAGQTLLIVKGDTKINLTNEGFMYARNNPEKLKSIIKEKVDPLLN